MYYSKIKYCDIANGSGVRVTLFVSGCRNHCEGCFQPETWDFHYGQPFTEKTAAEIRKLLEPGWIDGLTLLGGEPMEPENVGTLTSLVRAIRADLPGKTVWCFSGYSFERLAVRPDAMELIRLLDVLVDGPFRLDLYSPGLKFRGSRNQRLIDVSATLRLGRVITLSGGVHERPEAAKPPREAAGADPHGRK